MSKLKKLGDIFSATGLLVGSSITGGQLRSLASKLHDSPSLYIIPVTNWKNYDTIYTERFMSTPEKNPNYDKGSPNDYAKNLKAPYLLIHGTGDDNVHYQSFEFLVNELIKLGKPFDMMAYPNRSHSIREGEGTTLHLFSLMTRYLNEHLPVGGR